MSKSNDNSRRDFMKKGAMLSAAVVAGATTVNAQTNSSNNLNPNNLGRTPFKVTAYGMPSANAPFTKLEITRRALNEDDILIDILYASICHSDIHTAHQDWGSATFPLVPGHEMAGRVIAVGTNVKKFKIGDIAGVGCMVNSCGVCENCLNDREQNCLNGTTFTYNSNDTLSGNGAVTYGGYSDKMVVREKFAIRMPSNVDLAAYTPLLCAGITTFSPIQHWDVKKGQKIGVVGFGGLGHMAVKLAVSKGAEVTVFTTTPSKVEHATRMGATAVVWSEDNINQISNQHLKNFDFMIAALPVSFKIQPFMNMLKLDATLVNVGSLGLLEDPLNGMALGFGRNSFAGSMIGGIAETQEVIDYCVARDIKSDIEMITPEEIDKAYENIINKEVRFRYVIDIAKTKQA